MKAITLTQPWAQLVALGEKRIETRSWSTKYRGPLAIHAAKGFPGWAKDTCYQPPFVVALWKHRIMSVSDLPTGVIVATCELVRVVRIGPDVPLPTGNERSFGDYREKRYMWFLENIVRLADPIPAKGALSLWECDSVICSQGYEIEGGGL